MAAIIGTVFQGVASIGFTVAQKNISSSIKSDEFEPEGLVNLVQLGLLSQTQTHAVGTLIGFKDHSVQYYPDYPIPYVQGISRWLHSEEKHDLSILPDYLGLIMRRVWISTNTDEQKKDIETIAKFAIKGLEALKTSYEQHLKGKDPKALGVVKNYLNKSIDAINSALLAEAKEPPVIAIDVAVRENYAKNTDYRFVAQQIESLTKPGNTFDLNMLYVKTLNSWAKTKIAEFQIIKAQVLRKGNLHS